jgi:hypothetical protein
VEKQLENQKPAPEDLDEVRHRDADEHTVKGPTEGHPMGSFPPFTDPAFSFNPERSGPKKQSPISAQGEVPKRENEKPAS